MRGLGSGHVTCGPIRGLEKNCVGRGQTNKQTEKHRDSMTESAQWADSVKMYGVAPVIAYPPPANTTTVHSWLVQ